MIVVDRCTETCLECKTDLKSQFDSNQEEYIEELSTCFSLDTVLLTFFESGLSET